MSEGNIIIDAVIRAAAIDEVHNVENDSCIVVWKANAAEQIEAAIDEFGYKLVKKDE
jgi:hypothetical protein